MDDDCKDYTTNFLDAVNSVAPIKTIRVKYNTQPRFNIDILNAIQNRGNHDKKFRQSGKEINKDDFKNDRKIIYFIRKKEQS